MSVLNRIYASPGSELLHGTLEVSDGVVRHYLTDGFQDLEALLESGVLATFLACAISIALPKRSNDGKQDLKFALSNIDGSVSGFIRTALKAKREISLIYREYIDSDLSAPVKILHYQVKSGTVTATEAQITAGYFNLLETAWPRNYYTTDLFPGLRYLT
ncbi:DUF1833 domain-containing protein [Pseudomonas chlororaphis]|uniref:DUF1833 domain-containing protein n=1 Tax=Pseudomonas chlororaphis TaxID=587753 RepID=A0AB34C5T2_9PSED|nr:DUF1833 family protein [Pseudomonas chlororaphis]KAA5841982.1 DUF1833 domain-containing protein [Pseudomonas chlororaphis]